MNTVPMAKEPESGLLTTVGKAVASQILTSEKRIDLLLPSVTRP